MCNIRFTNLQIIGSDGKFSDLILNALYQNEFSLLRQAQQRFWSKNSFQFP